MIGSKTKELERVCLAALIQYNQYIPDIASICSADKFVNREHQVLYSLIVAAYSEHSKVDAVLLITHAKASGITKIHDVDVADYVLEVLSLIQINKDLVEEYYRELIKYHVLRKTHIALGECQRYIEKNLVKPVNEILPELDKKLTEATTLDSGGNVEFFDVWGDMERICKERAESGKNYSISLGFPLFDKLYGGARLGHLLVYAMPYKAGKSTLLLQIAKNAASIKSNNCKVLIVDTEMTSQETLMRNAASESGVRENQFNTGTFIESKESISRAEYAWDVGRKMAGKISHVFVLDRDFTQVSTIIRNWHAKNIKEGESALVIIDYLKLGDGEHQEMAEWQQIGLKTNAMKILSSSLARTAIITAVQTAHGNENVSMGNRIKWISSMVFLVTKKSEDEKFRDGEKYGSHKMVPLATRYLGDMDGYREFLKCQVGDNKFKYIPNYINYEFKNFVVSEKGCLEDSLNGGAGQLQPENTEDPYQNTKF